MRHNNAHRRAWALSAALAVAVVIVQWASNGVDLDWLLRAAGVGASAAFLAIGFSLRQRQLDEPVLDEILCAYEAQLQDETE